MQNSPFKWNAKTRRSHLGFQNTDTHPCNQHLLDKYLIEYVSNTAHLEYRNICCNTVHVHSNNNKGEI